MNEAATEIPLFTEKDKARFWANVDKRSENECWEWKPSVASTGYGKSWLKSIGQIDAHRLSWIFHYGPIAKDETYHGPCVCHKCDNRKCVNPAHLFLGSIKDNVHDMINKGRRGNPAGRGEKHHSAKLTAADVLEIRRLRETGSTLQSIADLFGISNPSVHYICARKKWAHIP